MSTAAETPSVETTNEQPQSSSTEETAQTLTPQVAESPKQGETPNAQDTAVSEQYEAFTLPEGWVAADADLEAFRSIASELSVRADGKGLTQEGAQQLVDMFIGIEGNRAEYLGQLQEQQTSERDAQWQEQLHNDPDIGGDKFPETQANIAQLEKSGMIPEALVQMLVETGYFKHPEMIRHLSKLGGMLQEQPTLFSDGQSPGDGKTQAQRMFANSGHV